MFSALFISSLALSLSLCDQMSNASVADDDDDGARALRRVRRLSLHLASPSPPVGEAEGPHQLSPAPCAKAQRVSVANPPALAAYMRGKHWDVQERVSRFFSSRPDLQTPIGISLSEHRELCLRQLQALVRDAGVRPFRYVLDEPAVYFAIAQAVGSVDMSLAIKMGVQYR